MTLRLMFRLLDLLQCEKSTTQNKEQQLKWAQPNSNRKRFYVLYHFRVEANEWNGNPVIDSIFFFASIVAIYQFMLMSWLMTLHVFFSYPKTDENTF